MFLVHSIQVALNQFVSLKLLTFIQFRPYLFQSHKSLLILQCFRRILSRYLDEIYCLTEHSKAGQATQIHLQNVEQNGLNKKLSFETTTKMSEISGSFKIVDLPAENVVEPCHLVWDFNSQYDNLLIKYSTTSPQTEQFKKCLVLEGCAYVNRIN